MKSTSTMLNPGRSAAKAQHLRLLPSHSSIAKWLKITHEVMTCEIPEI